MKARLKPGQLFTCNKKVYRVSKRCANLVRTCDMCREHNGIPPCKENPLLECLYMCGLEMFPETIK